MVKEKPPKQITNFDELVKVYQWQLRELESKESEGYWLRYLLRRIPLFSGVGMMFFGICLALAMTSSVGIKQVDSFLKNLSVFRTDCAGVVVVLNFALLVLFFIIIPWLFMIREKLDACDSNESNSNQSQSVAPKQKDLAEGDEGVLFGLKRLFALALLSGMLFFGFSWVMAQSPSLLYGLIVFSVITLGALLVDRVLGFTRRNERYQLFSNRAKGLIVLSRSRRLMAINGDEQAKFGEAHLMECAAFFDELRSDKHNATVSDSFYMLRLNEKLLNRKD